MNAKMLGMAKFSRIGLVAVMALTSVGAARAQDAGFGLDDPYRHYADPGNGGGSAYAPFFDPYEGPRVVRGAAPNAYYVPPSRYGKSAPPSIYDEPGYSYDRSPQAYVDPYTNGRDPYAAEGGRGRYDLGQNASVTTRAEVENTTGQPAGTIVIDTGSRELFLTQSNGRAMRYGIGVGRQGFAWHGTAAVQRKAEWPGWTPPAEMVKRRPDLPTHMEGGIENPLGARAMYLYQGKRDTMFRIHGTNEPDTIGQAVSSGCIRMMNADVIDLYRRVPLGTRVVVL